MAKQLVFEDPNSSTVTQTGSKEAVPAAKVPNADAPPLFILLNGQQVSLESLTRISDNLDKELEEITHTAFMLHELLLEVEKDIYALDSRILIREAEAAKPLRKLKEEGNKSITEAAIKEAVDLDIEKQGLEKSRFFMKQEAKRLSNLLQLLWGKREIMRDLYSRTNMSIMNPNIKKDQPINF
jgi:hypothetical protein